MTEALEAALNGYDERLQRRAAAPPPRNPVAEFFIEFDGLCAAVIQPMLEKQIDLLKQRGHGAFIEPLDNRPLRALRLSIRPLGYSRAWFVQFVGNPNAGMVEVQGSNLSMFSPEIPQLLMNFTLDQITDGNVSEQVTRFLEILFSMLSRA
jgi:hypothetical protein